MEMSYEAVKERLLPGQWDFLLRTRYDVEASPAFYDADAVIWESDAVDWAIEAMGYNGEFAKWLCDAIWQDTEGCPYSPFRTGIA